MSRTAFCLAILVNGSASLIAGEKAASVNLAINRLVASSSIENDEHDASHANDGREDTCWTADDEPEGEPDWWQVDLGSPHELGACEITWPFDGMNYRYKVEGSADQKRWQLLSDQTQTRSRLRSQLLNFSNARGIRYLRITITGFDVGCCAGISEVKVFGASEMH